MNCFITVSWKFMDTKYPRLIADNSLGMMVEDLLTSLKNNQRTCSVVNVRMNEFHAITDNWIESIDFVYIHAHSPVASFGWKCFPLLGDSRCIELLFPGTFFAAMHRIGNSICLRFHLITLNRMQSSRTYFIIVWYSFCARNSIGDRLTVSHGSGGIDRRLTGIAYAAPWS